MYTCICKDCSFQGRMGIYAYLYFSRVFMTYLFVKAFSSFLKKKSETHVSILYMNVHRDDHTQTCSFHNMLFDSLVFVIYVFKKCS